MDDKERYRVFGSLLGWQERKGNIVNLSSEMEGKREIIKDRVRGMDLIFPGQPYYRHLALYSSTPVRSYYTVPANSATVTQNYLPRSPTYSTFPTCYYLLATLADTSLLPSPTRLGPTPSIYSAPHLPFFTHLCTLHQCLFFLFLSLSLCFAWKKENERKRMKEIRKRPETEESDEVVGKRPRMPSLSEVEEGEEEDEEEMLLCGSPVDEEMLMEVMKVLEKEISCPASNYANNNGNTDGNPSSSVMYSPSSSFVTINGYEESCGPSFSDSASTVMANIDMGSISFSYLMGPATAPVNGISFPTGSNGPTLFPETSSTEEALWWPEDTVGDASVSSFPGEGIINEGFECKEVEESDDEWLARVLSEVPFEFEV